MSTSMMEFKFKYGGKGFGSKKGQALANELILDGARLPFPLISKTATVKNNLVLYIRDASKLEPGIRNNTEVLYAPPQGVLVLDIQNGQSVELKRQIDRTISRELAKSHKLELEGLGVAQSFAATECPHCASVVDTSELEATPYTYCPYCEVIFNSRSKEILPDTLDHSFCPECRMYGLVSSYTDFLFYFLVFVYGFHYQEKHLCPTCANQLANRMLLKNAIFVLGLVPATYAKVKAMTTGDKDMNNARSLSVAGRHEAAAPLYQKLYSVRGNHPALLMNEAMGHLFRDDTQGGIAILTKALQECSNYYPALNMIQSFQKAKFKNY